MTDSNNAAIDSLGYAAALSELEAILAELERDNVDVDRLASQVQRASELIRLCRERIGNAKLQIEHVVAELGA
jgi:exodeoxyribonuclease VII small subunit